MRLLFAGVVGGLVGLLQLGFIWFIEAQDVATKSGLLGSDLAFPLFTLLVLFESVGVMALSMYRVAPWILRLLRADWEAQQVLAARIQYGTFLAGGVIVATILRRTVVMIDTRSWSLELLLSLVVALLALLVPRPKTKPGRT